MRLSPKGTVALTYISTIMILYSGILVDLKLGKSTYGDDDKSKACFSVHSQLPPKIMLYLQFWSHLLDETEDKVHPLVHNIQFDRHSTDASFHQN
jgi:hypothetical protein